jgi:hypothetical protein
MARSSGVAGRDSLEESFEQAEFASARTGFRYQVARGRGFYTLAFGKADGTLRGEKSLRYFVGSGAAARSYLLADAGYFFEAPAAYYSRARKWSFAPAYDSYAYPYLSRPAMPACLTCHASFLTLVAGTQNKYETPPFAEGGIACVRCHGAGEAHIRKMREGGAVSGVSIVNPAKLAPEMRDSICAQCHLSGEMRVMKPGRDWTSYQPGARLADSMTVFVRAGATSGMTVTSHVEKLAQSACQRHSGDRLWCGTCHDPHSVPKPSERAAWFRGKCLGCHEPTVCKETRSARARRQDDCTSCHMPKSNVTDAQHVVYTDHSIPRRQRTSTAVSARPELAPFGGGQPEPRDLALALGILASRTQSADDRARAIDALQPVERASPKDVEVLLYLAELYRNTDQANRAEPLYRRAMQLDLNQVTASVGLGAILMGRGEYAGAIQHWQDALEKNSGLELVRINLAMAQWRSGDLNAAERTLTRAVDLSPGFAAPLDLLQSVREQIRRWQ